jgi:hypothetical protein
MVGGFLGAAHYFQPVVEGRWNSLSIGYLVGLGVFFVLFIVGGVAALHVMKLHLIAYRILLVILAFQAIRFSGFGYEYLFQSGMGLFLSVSNEFPQLRFDFGIGSKATIGLGESGAPFIVGVNIVATGMIGVLLQWYDESGRRLLGRKREAGDSRGAA